MDASPLNVTTLLIIALGMVAAYFLMKKRLDSNLTLLFYIILLGYATWSDRQVNTFVFGAGLVFALILRFEFMSKKLTTVFLWLELISLTAIFVSYLGIVFNFDAGF
jgi:hypothetical protein